jgi:hypothetical protein
MQHRSSARVALEGVEGCLILGAALASWPLSQRWLKNWGSTPAERARDWPGDRLVPSPHEAYLRAIAIDASADDVWKWVVQFGLGRAGFYSYELLERLVGIDVRNVESIEPAFQALEVGDEVRLHPKAPGIVVAEVAVGRRLCFGEEPPSAGDTPPRSWSLYVEPNGPCACRLLIRGCLALACASHGQRVAAAIEAPIDFAMEQRMLRTIKRLAEREAPSGVTAASRSRRSSDPGDRAGSEAASLPAVGPCDGRPSLRDETRDREPARALRCSG